MLKNAGKQYCYSTDKIKNWEALSQAANIISVQQSESKDGITYQFSDGSALEIMKPVLNLEAIAAIFKGESEQSKKNNDKSVYALASAFDDKIREERTRYNNEAIRREQLPFPLPGNRVILRRIKNGNTYHKPRQSPDYDWEQKYDMTSGEYRWMKRQG